MLKPGLEIRGDFPVFEHFGGSLAYLDSAASSQKPACVIERMRSYLSFEHSNIHRGAYALSARATQNYDQAREKISQFINSPDPLRIIFTKGTTEGINLVAYAFEDYFSAGDSILLTRLEHHSNIVPWQLLAGRKDLNIHFADIDSNAVLNMGDLKSKIERFRPKLVSVTWVSNAFGSVVPVADIVSMAKTSGAKVLIDASQAVMHREVDVTRLDPDFLVFTGHKMYGPTGIGVLYARSELLREMKPFHGGGDMIEQVTVDGSTWAEPPRKFEAGTPPIAEAIALGEAVDFISRIGISNIKEYETQLFSKAWELFSKQKDLTLYGPANAGGEQASIISFSVNGVHPHDFATIADSVGVQVRAGHHCAMPAMEAMGIEGTARASIGVYSDISDFERLLEAVKKARAIMG